MAKKSTRNSNDKPYKKTIPFITYICLSYFFHLSNGKDFKRMM